MSSSLSFFGVPGAWARRSAVASIVTVSLGVSLGASQPASAAPVSHAAASKPVAKPVTERPDGFSASVTARLKGSRVEDLSQRTESTSTFVNPDGTWTTEDHGAPIRVMQDGEWRDVDLDLVKQADGTWAPKVSPVDVVVDGGGSSEAGEVSFGDGTSLAVTWPGGTLPTPTVDGGVATYKVSDTTDLLVTMTNEGLNTWLRLNEKPKDTDQAFTFGLKADGVDVNEHGDGLTVTDDDGKRVGGVSQLEAWDAQTDADGGTDERGAARRRPQRRRREGGRHQV